MTTDDFTEAAMAYLAMVDHDKSQDWFDGAVATIAWARTHLAAQEPTDAELDALYDAFMAHSEDERSEEYTRTEDGEPYHERSCSECGEAVWIKGEHYWAATRANGARKRHHVARAALRAARDAVEDADYWQARAYEAEGKLWKAEARIKAWEKQYAQDIADANRETDEAEARIRAVWDVLADYAPEEDVSSPVPADPIRRALKG